MRGIAFHCHHDRLFEYVHDYYERVDYFKNHKPEHEQELRLRLFKFIPVDRLPQKGLVAYIKACDACYKAWDAYDKENAVRSISSSAKVELETLHKELCPDCPWNGETIF